MSSNLEIQKEQRRKLYELLNLKKNHAADLAAGLEKLINATEAEMEAEDVAYVEKKIAELNK